MRPLWKETFHQMCDVVAARSPDPNTQVGCVITTPNNILLSTGYNGFPRGVQDFPHRFLRPAKYDFFEHAERNAIYNAARQGVKLDGCIVYLPGMPCKDCARALIQVGCTAVYPRSSKVPQRWFDSCVVALSMLEEAEVYVDLGPRGIWHDEVDAWG